MIDRVHLVGSGDLRPAANRMCWPAQERMERRLGDVFAALGVSVERAHRFDATAGHGFISSQRMGMDVFRAVPRESAVVVAVAAWQYSHHLLAGLRSHRGPILTVANWSGEWPGLVGLLNLNGSLTKANVGYSSLWSETFDDDFFREGLRAWVESGSLHHETNHVHDLDTRRLPAEASRMGREIATRLDEDKAILGVFDEGCMGMYNAIIDDEMLNPMGIYKERLSQSALLAQMQVVTDDEARSVRTWLDDRGMTFKTGSDEATELTGGQILDQCRMYIAALRMASSYGCDAIGIQYQQGLKDMAPASDLIEGLLNNVDRPPAYAVDGVTELFPNRAMPHFNEVDEGAAVDALVTNRVWRSLGLDPATTLHDIRWGERYVDDGIDAFVWVFEISGAAPPSHLIDGYRGAVSERQPPMFFPLGGGTLKGVSKPGEIVWSRVYVMDGRLHADLGRGTVVALPRHETERRWRMTTPQWPIMHAVLHGVGRDEMMARHKANHVQVAYGPGESEANRALAAKAAAFQEMGMEVHLCGEVWLG